MNSISRSKGRDSAFRKVRLNWGLTGLFAFISIMFSIPAVASVTDFWSQSDETNSATIDHSQWQTVLDRYLITDDPSNVNLFNYQAVKSSDRKLLGQYLQSMQTLDPRRYNKREQMAYWINLYNALTVQLILDNYPVKSITKLGDSLFSFGPWDDDAAKIQGKTLSLNHIEHKILRPIWKDLRIHYAVNCASFSCPNLSAQAFTSQNTEQLLNEGAAAYINHPRGIQVDGNDLIISSIYDWYIEDFGDNQSSLLEHFKAFAKPDLLIKLHQFESKRGDIDHNYDWSLNKPK
ncbi:DUF547 domain-containing protein [Litoribacillus peritrichatus]|uniref:DUF547 domain-containing protein n=1 Tax=Litoribacillus peritrichatus TaxID=718191 RepID=A0ABP7MTK6_9GAMM